MGRPQKRKVCTLCHRMFAQHWFPYHKCVVEKLQATVEKTRGEVPTVIRANGNRYVLDNASGPQK